MLNVSGPKMQTKLETKNSLNSLLKTKGYGVGIGGGLVVSGIWLLSAFPPCPRPENILFSGIQNKLIQAHNPGSLAKKLC